MSDPDRPSAAAWLESKSSDPALVVVGVPWDAGSRGHRSPRAVRDSLDCFSTFHSEAGIDLGTLPVEDAGDWAVGDSDPITAQSEIERRTGGLQSAATLIILGGDPAITRPVINGLGVAQLGLLTFSARHRTGPTHAPPNDATVSGLIEDGLAGHHIAQVGLHGFSNSQSESEFSDGEGISQFPMDTIDLWGIEETVRVALDQLASSRPRIYVTFDAGGLDSAYAPGAPDGRPGGLSPRQLSTAALQCGRHPQVVAADFVGIDTDRDDTGLTVMNLAAVLLSFAAGVALRQAMGQ